MKLSIVSTMYHSERFVGEFYKRIVLCADRITPEWELILVNDGSPDDSLAEAKKLVKNDSRVRVIDLSRNFGHHKAIITGLTYARGEYVFLIDIDLEEKPELLSTFWHELQNDLSVDVVYGVQESRKGGLFERFSGRLFYDLFNFLSDVRIDADLLIARLMTQNYVRNLCRYQEADVVFAGAAALTGFKQKSVKVTKGHKKETTYSLSRKIAVMIDVLTSCGPKPLIMVSYAGAAILAIPDSVIVVLLYQRFVLNMLVEGWTSVIASIWFLGGLMLFCLGLVGIYVAKIFNEVKNRPFTIVKEEISSEPADTIYNRNLTKTNSTEVEFSLENPEKTGSKN